MEMKMPLVQRNKECEYRGNDGLCLHPMGGNTKMPNSASELFSSEPREAVYCNCPCIGKECNVLKCELMKCEDCGGCGEYKEGRKLK